MKPAKKSGMFIPSGRIFNLQEGKIYSHFLNYGRWHESCSTQNKEYTIITVVDLYHQQYDAFLNFWLPDFLVSLKKHILVASGSSKASSGGFFEGTL